ncbi:MAG: phosphoketolase, partial [Acidimicrobiia bacterium]
TLYVCGTGHGAAALYANAWLEGGNTACYPSVRRVGDGIGRLIRTFSMPYGKPSHAAPETPGSIHEGGELGYSLSHAQGAALDCPGEQVVCVIGDGEAETGALGASWLGGRFLRPGLDGSVLPVLHLNGWKIANPTVLARLPESELLALLHGYGYHPIVVAGDDPATVHGALADALDEAGRRLDELHARTGRATPDGSRSSVHWPMIVLRTPKGWTAPAQWEGRALAGSFRSHQVPLPDPAGDPAQLELLERWLRSYAPDELFDEAGAPAADLDRLIPQRCEPMSRNPRANGGTLRRELDLPPLLGHAVAVGTPAADTAPATAVLAGWLAEVMDHNPDRFRLVGPDEVASNRLGAVLDGHPRAWPLAGDPADDRLDPEGRVLEVLSEHLCQGWLEGYVLTGRHGLFTSYEAFVHIVDSMFNQYAKWLEAAARVDWRRDVSSFTYLLTSHVWRQDHNGFSHQDPGFLDVVANKRAELVRIDLPPDANTLLVTMRAALSSTNRVNVVVAGKQPAPQYLDLEAADRHCRRGMGVWPWAGNEAERGEPDVVLACAGDVPTGEALAAARLLDELTGLSVRVVNVVNLLALQGPELYPSGLTDAAFDALFTVDRPVVFAFHGYPWLIHRLVYRRRNHQQFHVRGYVEEGSTTSPFDMVVRNRLDRFHLALIAVEHAGGPVARQATVRQQLEDRLAAHLQHVRAFGEDLPELRAASER